MTKVTIGSKIKVTTDWTDHYKVHTKLYRDLYSIQVHEGEVVKSGKNDPVGTFRLHTGNKSYPVSIIPLHRVTQIENLDGFVPIIENFIPTPIDNDFKSWTVAGSKGDSYVVTVKNNIWSCDCSGFMFRKTCKHVKEKQLELLGE